MDKCAPGVKYSQNSCISLDILIDMAKAYNKTYPEDKIQLQFQKMGDDKYKKFLIKELNKRLKDVCGNDQQCWAKQSFIDNMQIQHRKRLESNTWRPKGLSGRFKWLNTSNINDIMEQYEDVYSDFKFLGAVPMDFDDLDELGINTLDFAQLKKHGIRQFGIVFNLDEHYKKGSHWVGMYCNIETGQIYYFDSYGVFPEDRVMYLVNRFNKYYRSANNKSIDFNYNNRRYQFGNSECGVFSIHFILRMLKGETFADVLTKPINDTQVNKCRKVYFSNAYPNESPLYDDTPLMCE